MESKWNDGGEWIINLADEKEKRKMKCSNCSAKFKAKNSEKYNYCPICGDKKKIVGRTICIYSTTPENLKEEKKDE